MTSHSNSPFPIPDQIDHLNARAWDLRQSDPLKALDYARQAAALAESHGDSFRHAESLHHAGVALLQSGSYPEALKTLEQALDLAKQHDETAQQAKIYNVIGVIYHHLGDYAPVFDLFQQALALSRQCGDEKGTAAALNHLGILHHDMMQYDRAVAYLEQSLALFRQLDAPMEIAITLSNLANAYDELGQPETALRYHHESLELHRQLGNPLGEANSMTNLAIALAAQGQSAQALAYFQQSLALRRPRHDRLGITQTLISLADFYFEQGEMASAMASLQEASDIAVEIGAKSQQHRIHHLFAQIYEATGDYQNALTHLKQCRHLEQLLHREETDNQLKNLQLLHQVETARKEAEIYRLKNIELAALLQEKDEFLGIAAHDLKNPLSSISSTAHFIRLQYDRLSREELIEFMGYIENGAARMFTLIRNLLDLNALESGKLNLSLNLVDWLPVTVKHVEEYLPAAAAKQIALELDVPDTACWVIADEDAIVQVVDNLISNAIKYSPPETTVRVRLKRVNNRIRLEVQDEGPGFSPEDRNKLFKRFSRLKVMPTGGEHSTGLGLSIVKKLVEAMHGNVDAESPGAGHGSIFSVELPAGGDVK